MNDINSHDPTGLRIFDRETARGRITVSLIKHCFVILELPYIEDNQEGNQITVDSVTMI